MVSIMVNLDIIGRYFQLLGGVEELEANHFVLHSPICFGSLDIIFAGTGMPGSCMTRSKFSFLDCCHLLGINEFFVIRDHIEDVVRMKDKAPGSDHQSRNESEEDELSCTLNSTSTKDSSLTLSCTTNNTPILSTKAVISLLRISCWDADLFWQFGEQLLEVFEKGLSQEHDLCNSFFVEFLKEHFDQIMDGYIPSFDVSDEISQKINRIKRICFHQKQQL